MSRKPIKPINWAALIELTPESEKGAITAFKAKSDQYMQRLLAHPETPPKIDWSYYQRNISSDLVNKFQKQYESLSIPYPADKVTAAIDAEQKELAKKMEIFVQGINVQIQEATVEINKIKDMLPFALMTLEDYVTLVPNGMFSKENPTIWPHDIQSQEDANVSDDKKNSH